MATNPYSYGSLGTRWTVGEPTSKSLLDISRVKNDANRWTLEQLITDPDDSATLGFGLSFESSEQRTLQIHNTDISNYFQIYGGRAGSPTSDHLVFSTGTNGTIMEFDGANHWITFHDTVGVQKMYYRGDGSPGLILESGVFLTVGGLITASAGISGTTGTFSGATTVGSAGATADFAVWTDGTSSTAAGFTVDASADEVIVGQLSGGGNTTFKVRNRLNNTVFSVTPDAPSTTVFAPNIATGSAGTLTVKTGSINSDSIRLEAGGTTSTWLESRGYLGHSWYVDSTRSMTLDSTGLGVGVDSPSTPLHIQKSLVSDLAKFEDTGTNSNPNIQITNDARSYQLQTVGARSDNFEIWDRTAGATRLAITSTGAVEIPNQNAINELTFTGTDFTNVFSNTTSGMQFGTTGAGSYLALYAANAETARVTADGITFNGDTAAANALDDYEEGTWTPTFTPSTSGSITLAAGGGAYYTKIGQLVTATLSVTVASVSSPIGYVSVNLPFAPNTSNQKGRSGVAIYVDGLAAGHNTRDAIALTEDSSASLRIYQGDSNSNQADFAQAVGSGTYFNLTVSYIV